MKSRLYLLVALSLVMTLVLAACGTPTPAPTTTGTGTESGGTESGGTESGGTAGEPAVAGEPPSTPTGTLIVALPLEPNSVNPPNGADRMAGNVINQIFESLLAIDNSTGEVIPALATEWTVAEDGSVYSFKLREGVTFHDGSAFNAQDVVATFEAGADPANAYAGSYDGVVVEVVDDYNVNIMPPTPDVTFLRTMAETPIISDEQFAAEGNAGIESNPIGTGPFQFVEWNKGDRLVLEANPDYWDEGKPYLAEVIFRPIPESSTRLAAIQTGEVHIVNRLNSDEAASLDGVSGVQVVTYPADRVYYITFNNLTTGVGLPTEDKAVRQAMNYAVDRQAIVDGLFNGNARLSTGFVTPSNLGFDDTLEPYPYDPETAKQLLADAGYADGFSIGMSCPVGAYTNFEDVCQAIANYLGEVGITLDGGEIEFLESGVYWDREAAKELPPLFGDSWSASVGEALPRLNGALDGFDASYSAWSDPEIDALLDQIAQEFDTDARAELYKELQAYMYDNPPFIYLYEPISFEAINSAVQGYVPNSVEQYYLKDVWLGE
ncbi:MAG: ABC transporter substrate-binding protein [Caldilineaceae bacterium]